MCRLQRIWLLFASVLRRIRWAVLGNSWWTVSTKTGALGLPQVSTERFVCVPFQVSWVIYRLGYIIGYEFNQVYFHEAANIFIFLLLFSGFCGLFCCYSKLQARVWIIAGSWSLSILPPLLFSWQGVSPCYFVFAHKVGAFQIFFFHFQRLWIKIVIFQHPPFSSSMIYFFNLRSSLKSFICFMTKFYEVEMCSEIPCCDWW